MVLAEFEGHHEWKALAILRMASSQFFAVLVSSTPDPHGRVVWVITRLLKTSNEQVAVDLGRRLLFQLEQRADQGLPPKSKLFGGVIDDYIRHRERDHRHGGTTARMLRQIIQVSRFWREYAGELAVEVIDDKVMREFRPTLSRQAMEHRNRRSTACNDCYNDDCDQAGAGHCSVLHLGRQGPHYQGRRILRRRADPLEASKIHRQIGMHPGNVMLGQSFPLS